MAAVARGWEARAEAGAVAAEGVTARVAVETAAAVRAAAGRAAVAMARAVRAAVAAAVEERARAVVAWAVAEREVASRAADERAVVARAWAVRAAEEAEAAERARAVAAWVAAATEAAARAAAEKAVAVTVAVARAEEAVAAARARHYRWSSQCRLHCCTGPTGERGSDGTTIGRLARRPVLWPWWRGAAGALSRRPCAVAWRDAGRSRWRWIEERSKSVNGRVGMVACDLLD